MKKILCLFDYGPNCYTGFATVSRNIVQQLKAHFGDSLCLDIVAINYFDKPYTEYNGTVRVISGKLGQNVQGVPDQFKQGDDFGRLQFLTMLRDEEYDGIFFILDLGVIAPIVPLIKRQYDVNRKTHKKLFRSMIYFPVDGMLHSKVKNEFYNKSAVDKLPVNERQYYDFEWIEQVTTLNLFDRVVTYTKFAREELKKHNEGLTFSMQVLYHGINTADFYPMNKRDRAEFRERNFGRHARKIIVGVINRNQPRKDIPTAIFGFIEARKQYKPTGRELFLYLHMKPEDAKGWNLHNLLSQTDLVEGVDYMFPKLGDHNQQVTIAKLNEIYNSLDIYLSTALGEGWGLTTTEAMACKVPCIIPKHTSLQEIGEDGRAFFLEESLPVSVIDDNAMRYMCHFDEVGEVIGAVSQKIADGAELPEVQKAYDWVTALTWDNICKKWIRNFEEVFDVTK